MAAVTSVFVLLLVPTSPASATGGEWLGCRITPPGTAPVRPGCVTSRAASSYSVYFQVQNGTGSYTYSWNTNGWPAYLGCTATSNSCILRVAAHPADQQIPVSVTITQAGRSATLNSSALIPAVCGSVLC